MKVSSKMAIDTVKQDVRDECNNLTRKLAQLKAMLSMTYGDAEETFSGMNDDLRDSFMWACSDMADECHALSETISATVHRHTHKTLITA